MKLCFVVDSYPTVCQSGGIAVFTQTAARALAARGHEVHVLVARRDAEGEETDGAVRLHVRRVHWLPVLGKWLPGLGESRGVARALRKLHAAFHFDLVEFPNWEGLGFASVVHPVTRTVVRLHTSMAESIEMAARKPALGDRFMMWTERVSARRATAVVTHSLAHRDRLRRTYGLGEVAVIPHGIPLPPVAEPPPESFAVLNVGLLNTRKGAATLLKAVALVMEAVPGAEFWIAGSPEEHPLAKQFRKENPGLDRVRFLGFITGEELADVYARCAVYVSASRYESFGLTFAEAMARGKPVVGCAAGAIPELIQDGVNGLLVPPADAGALAGAVTRLMRDPAERRRMGEAGGKLAREKFCDTRMAADIERFFESVCA